MLTSSNYVLNMVVLEEMIRNLDGNTHDAVAQIAFAVEGRAKINAPVDTGALRASIYVSMKRVEGGDVAMRTAASLRPEAVITPLPVPRDDHTAYVGPSVEYGEPVELGSTRRAGTPYLQPALRATEGDAKEYLAKAISNGK